MRAMLLEAPRQRLRLAELPVPEPGPGQVLLQVHACAVCRTDLHVADGELSRPKLPLVLGHEVVGQVVGLGAGVVGPKPGDRLGVPWLGSTCGQCAPCRSGRENLCEEAEFTGYTLDGGFADYAVADARFAFPIPSGIPDVQAAPLLCAGAIGYRALRMAGEARRVGLYGFGASAHILLQVLRFQGRHVYAFTRPGDVEAQRHALSLGADWAGASDEAPPEPLDAAILFAPVGALIPRALAHTAPGGVVVCAGIHMSDIPSFPYSLLWRERVLRSVANLTRLDAAELLSLAPQIPVRCDVQVYSLEQADDALQDLRAGRVRGAAVLDLAASQAPRALPS